MKGEGTVNIFCYILSIIRLMFMNNEEIDIEAVIRISVIFVSVQCPRPKTSGMVKFVWCSYRYHLSEMIVCSGGV